MFTRVLQVLGLALFIFFIVGSMSVVVGTTLSILIGLFMLYYIINPDND